ncbi:hypothetical protein M1N20_01765 [Dehalococcoidia bacterium]|nr:hypothetical protein [Dehalococcoidia bacterium]
MLYFEPFLVAIADLGFEGSIILEVDDQRLLPTAMERVRQLIWSHLGWCRPRLLAELVATW